MRDCQVDAIQELEKSMRQDKPRALIRLATSADRDFTACTFSWHAVKHVGAKRVLFLVDRTEPAYEVLARVRQQRATEPRKTTCRRTVA
jgi:type I site-specific restriction endonuclease